MADQSLKDLRRVELLEIMLDLQIQLENIEKENAMLREQLAAQKIQNVDERNLAQAASRLSEIFEVAQFAADDYLQAAIDGKKKQQIEANQLLEQAQVQADVLLQQTKLECDAQRQKTQEACQKTLRANQLRCSMIRRGLKKTK